MLTKETIKNISHTLDSVVSRFEYCSACIPKLETEIVDIQHILELYEHDEDALLILAKELQKVLQERREMKKEVEMSRPLYHFICDNGKFTEGIKRLEREVDRIAKIQEGREFMPRIRNDLVPPLLKQENSLEKLKKVLEMKNAENQIG